MKFTQIGKFTWESEEQTYTAVTLNKNREPVGILEARYVIEMGDHKGKTVYRLYERSLNHRQFIGRYATLELATKAV